MIVVLTCTTIEVVSKRARWQWPEHMRAVPATSAMAMTMAEHTRVVAARAVMAMDVRWWQQQQW